MMPRYRLRPSAAACLLVALSGVALAQQSPDDLLQRISDAVNDITYRGTMIRSVDGRIDTMHVLHSNRDGVVREKLVAMDGEGREIIRNGNELVCLLPDRRLKIVDTDPSPANALVRLPLESSDVARYYTLDAIGASRVAGRDVSQYFVRPRDGLRYGHRLWVDDDTMLPLRMQLVGRGRVVEEIRFTDIDIGIDIPDEAFSSDIDSEGFQVMYASAAPKTKPEVSTTRVGRTIETRGDDWPAEPSPGFRFRATQTQTLRINGQVMQRLVFSDGLATVSVFIATRRPGESAGDDTQVARLGAAHSYRRQVGDKMVTLVGEAPEQTLRMLAEHIEARLKATDSRATPVDED